MELRLSGQTPWSTEMFPNEKPFFSWNCKSSVMPPSDPNVYCMNCFKWDWNVNPLKQNRLVSVVWANETWIFAAILVGAVCPQTFCTRGPLSSHYTVFTLHGTNGTVSIHTNIAFVQVRCTFIHQADLFSVDCSVQVSGSLCTVQVELLLCFTTVIHWP